MIKALFILQASTLIKELRAKSALHRLKTKYLPYHWDLNIYRGCQHGCKYCYALYSHKYLASEDFYHDVYVKTNIVELLEKELSSRKWKKEVINIGGVCDSYQPLERKYGLMRKVLEVMIKYSNPITILTKSDLILRDLDLLAELSDKTPVVIGTTITSTDPEVQKVLEPGAPSSERRFEIVRQIKQKTKAKAGIHLVPIMPLINDDEENLDSIFAGASECGADYVLHGCLNLRSQTRKEFFSLVQVNYPALLPRYRQLYRGAFVDKTYKAQLYELIAKLRKKYGINNWYPSEVKLPKEPEQMRFL